MREELNHNIRTYTEVINSSFSDMSKEGKAKAETLKESAIEDGVKNAHTSKEAESQIYSIQKQKLEKFRKFKRWLEKTRQCIDSFDDTENNKDKPVVSMTKEGTPIITYKDGTYKIATIGEIISGTEWGESYCFDKSINIHDIREYHLMQLKKDLRDKLDNQIIESEISNTYVDTLKQEAYKQIKNRNENQAEVEKRGVIAEKMVSTFLEQLSIDCEDADFSITPADAYQDVNEKIDFIVHRKQHKHGVQVEEDENTNDVLSKDIGIQFTTAGGLGAHKENQIMKAKKHANDVDDIVLVTIPMNEATFLYKKWQEKKDPGGPTKYWSRDTKVSVFKAVMQNVLTKEEIEDFCQKYL